jgi:hypothetical protein
MHRIDMDKAYDGMKSWESLNIAPSYITPSMTSPSGLLSEVIEDY